MPYTQVQDVRDLAPYVSIDSDSQPSIGTVQTWITQIESDFNLSLDRMGYTVPLTDASSLAWARNVVAHLVMARVMRARPNPETDPEGFQRIADGQIKRLRDPNDTFELPGASDGDTARKESPTRVSSNLRDLDLLDPRPFAVRDKVF